MFNEYRYVKYQDRHIYYSLSTFEDHFEVSLYIDDKLVNRKSVPKGIHLVQHGDVAVRLEVTLLKVHAELTIGTEKVDAKKIKKKELQSILGELNIFNEINPRPVPREPFNPRKLILPSLLIILAIVLQVLTTGMGKLWGIPSILLLIIAYWQVLSPLFNKVPDRFMDENTRWKFKLASALACMILTQIIVEKII